MQNELQAFRRMLRRHGTTCRAFYSGAGRGVPFRAQVSNLVQKRGALSARRYASVADQLGVDAEKTKIMYAEYHEFFESDSPIRVLYRDHSYEIVYDSIIRIGDDPVYVMAILVPTSGIKDDYEPIGGDQND